MGIKYIVVGNLTVAEMVSMTAEWSNIYRKINNATNDIRDVEYSCRG